jgi:hypothetical protein
MPNTTDSEAQEIEVLRRQEVEAKQQQKQETAIVQQIQEARKDVESSVKKLHDLSLALRSKTRRSLDGGSSGYLVFANAHLRLAGALTQGVKRAASMDRVLKRAQSEQEETRRRAKEDRQRREDRAYQKQLQQLQQPSEDAFEQLYGEVVVNAD